MPGPGCSVPTDSKTTRPSPRRSPVHKLQMPAVGIESEFNVWVDGKEVVPEKYWKSPADFIGDPLLAREGRSSQTRAGGAVYFDRGVVEVVTPVIEIRRGCAERAVRSLWEQIGYVRNQLDQWEARHGHTVQLRAYSTHYNVSFDVPKWKQNRQRNVKRLALFLAYILPVPVMVLGANRRSTGIGVRPRGDRIEITADFTPDPAMMIATAAVVVGIVREVMSWPSYRLGLLRELPIPTIEGVIPGKHTTRKGWLTKDFHYPESPFTSDIDERMWTVRDGRTISLRRIAAETVWFFRKSIRQFADPFTYRLIFSILDGSVPSLLDLRDRPQAYDDVGRRCGWGRVIDELRDYKELQLPLEPEWSDYVRERKLARAQAVEASAWAAVLKTRATEEQSAQASGGDGRGDGADPALRARKVQARRASLLEGAGLDRRAGRSRAPGIPERRRGPDRRQKQAPTPFPDRRLSRSTYEQVFLRLVSGRKLNLNGQLFTPIGMKGWYHALFRSDTTGKQRLMTIDQLVRRLDDWV